MVDVPGATPQTPEQVVGAAIQDLAAVRLGRGFMPLACAFVVGFAQLFTRGPTAPDALILFVGAPLVAVAMLAHGLRIVQQAFGRPARPWMVLASLGSLLPPAFGLYLLGWRGLREITAGGGVALGVLFTVLGLWALYRWMKLNELIQLARVMAGVGEPGGWEGGR